jgi:hypothetical protein
MLVGVSMPGVWLKLHAWRLEQYDTIIFLDGDVILVHNMDHVFWHPQLLPTNDSLLGRVGTVYLGEGEMLSGFFVLHPSQRVYSSMLHGMLVLDAPVMLSGQLTRCSCASCSAV